MKTVKISCRAWCSTFFLYFISRMTIFDWLIRIQHLGCLYLAKLYKHDISFCSNEFVYKITKENNSINLLKHNITRYCSSTCKSRWRCCPSNADHLATKQLRCSNVSSAGVNLLNTCWISINLTNSCISKTQPVDERCSTEWFHVSNMEVQNDIIFVRYVLV